ncbi:MAG TPA: tetratricopeptide repeat protein [Kofleriaceae bacterium]|nr:tetratricopeptide repeat protein [Kofleriaceae bacterium]
MQRFAIALALVLTTTSVAEAQPAPVAPGDAEKIAKAKAASAKEHFDRGDYAVAVEEYREAYRLVPSPGLLYNLGQAYRLLGACAEAAEAYREYLRLVPDSPYRETAQQNQTAAEVCARDAEAAAKRRDAKKRAELPDANQPVTPPARDDGRGLRRAGVGAMAVGSGLVIAGGYFALDAARQDAKVSDFYENGGAWADVAGADERGRRAQLISRITFGAGAVALATGATLYVLGRRSNERAVAVTPRHDGAQVAVSWRF